MNVVLVSIGNFQPYILDNIRNLIALKHKNIYVIINENFKSHFDEFSPSIMGSTETESPLKLVFVESLKDIFHFYERSRLDKRFQNGFWVLTSLRIFYIYAFMEKYGVKDVIHLENDVVIYYNCDELLPLVNRNAIYIPFNSFSINVISIVYIPNSEVMKPLLANWNLNMLDMNVFAQFKSAMPHLVDIFPIFKEQPGFDNVHRMVCHNFTRFGKVFDGNAMGQYLGGIDPSNVGGSTKSTEGFVNKECCIKYDRFRFIWKEVSVIECDQAILESETMKKPFLCVGEDEIPIFNLHIHSKNLAKFVGGAGFSV